MKVECVFQGVTNITSMFKKVFLAVLCSLLLFGTVGAKTSVRGQSAALQNRVSDKATAKAWLQLACANEYKPACEVLKKRK